jgi:hypothetical protein
MHWIKLALTVMVSSLILIGAGSRVQAQDQAFPVDRSRNWVYAYGTPDNPAGTEEAAYLLTFTDRPVTMFPELTGTQASAECGSSRFVVSVIYLSGPKILLLSLFVRMLLRSYEPALNCALRPGDGPNGRPGNWVGVGTFKMPASFLTKLLENRLQNTSPCALISMN